MSSRTVSGLPVLWISSGLCYTMKACNRQCNCFVYSESVDNTGRHWIDLLDNAGVHWKRLPDNAGRCRAYIESETRAQNEGKYVEKLMEFRVYFWGEPFMCN